MAEETITISKTQWEEAQRKMAWLRCLERAGVDGWQGIEYAIDEYNKLYIEEEEDD